MKLTRAEREVHEVLLGAWRQADAEQDEPVADAVKATLSRLGWPWVSIPREPWHGTRSGYTNHGCRCGACKEAHAEYARGHRARRRATQEPEPERSLTR